MARDGTQLQEREARLPARGGRRRVNRKAWKTLAPKSIGVEYLYQRQLQKAKHITHAHTHHPHIHTTHSTHTHTFFLGPDLSITHTSHTHPTHKAIVEKSGLTLRSINEILSIGVNLPTWFPPFGADRGHGREGAKLRKLCQSS